MTIAAPSQDLLQFVPRRRDRRLGIGDVLMALTRALGDRSDPAAMRTVFEDVLRRMMPVRSITLRDAGRWTKTDAVESLSLEVPGGPGAMPGLLEAGFDAAAPLGDWDFQLLGLAAHLGALVLEIERGRAVLARAGVSGSARARRDGAAPLIGSTTVMGALRAQIERVAVTDFTVLLEGESGVGKELVARQIHELSFRRAGPFVPVNCAALVETLLEAELFGIEERTATGVRGRRGKFECADGGTLFLDEVSDLSPSAQAKLLRAIQDLAVERVGGNGPHRVDIRVVAATNRPLGSLVEQKLFRPDLYYRLSGVDVRVPPLRERRADILELARYFIDRHRETRRLRLSAEAGQALLAHDWPGNVRELERLIERAVALTESDVIELDDLPLTARGDYGAALGPSSARNDTLRAWASRYVRLVLARAGGNKRAACRMLDISYHTLAAHLKFPLPEEAGEPASAAPIGERTIAGCNSVVGV
ncbi:MAG TPA: sigma 54-interacting transcriptional regulator [Vicinamibacterales bacterium]|nr:sigma 54-interacting transcriptional regulator [Vicinamibacterales bacterium]